jgi:hypothetical protein
MKIRLIGEAGAPTLVRVADKSDEEIAVGHTLAHLTFASRIIR